MAKVDSYQSPQGISQHPWINTADTKFNANGVFHTKLVLSGEDAEVQAFKAKVAEDCEKRFTELTKALSAAERKKWKVYYPFEDVLDNDTGEATGDIAFTFKRNHIVKIDGEDKPLTVSVYDSMGNALPEDDLPAIYGGTVMSIACTFRDVKVPGTHQAGTKLDMFAVQIVKLAKGGGRSPFAKLADQDPDEIEAEGGYVFKASGPKAPKASKAADDGPAHADDSEY